MRAHVNFTRIHTQKLNDSGNQPLSNQDDDSNGNVNKLKKKTICVLFKLYRVYLASLEFSLKFQGDEFLRTFRPPQKAGLQVFFRQVCTERCFSHKTIDIPRMPMYRARTRARIRAWTRARTRRRTRQFFAFPPLSRPTGPMTFKRRVFVAIMEGKLELGLRVRLGLGAYELG